MVDTLSPLQRRICMASVASRNTAPEVLVRRLLFALGYRFRIHQRDLPGCPDIVFPRLKSCIFVHGCFWHGHTKCRKGNRPTSNVEFWNTKIDKNIRRDKIVCRKLRDLGWRRLVIWECQVRAPELESRIREFLESAA